LPLATIEILEGRGPAEKRALLEAVRDAVVAGLRVPESDVIVRIDELAHQDVLLAAAASRKLTIVNLRMFLGRSPETKRRLYRAIAHGLAPLGVPPDELQIVLHEPPLESWGIKGGVPASELELGFDLRG
jgi:phenylpyruvate tautomerase PptA (4-oxalocrotonate tautomerase family)